MTTISEIREWLKGVIAHEKQQTALIVVGGEGSGKTLFAQTLMERIGNVNCAVLRHGPEIFNGGMVAKSLIVFDEWRGDIEKLKPYITEPTVEVEFKAQAPFRQDNRTNYLLLAHDHPALPAGDRRFLMATPLVALSVLANVGHLVPSEAPRWKDHA